MRSRTTLVIAHGSRPSRKPTASGDGRGRIVELETHQELLARNGQYAVLHRLQFSE